MDVPYFNGFLSIDQSTLGQHWCSIIGNGYTKRSAMLVPSSLKPRTLSPFGGVYGIGGSSPCPPSGVSTESGVAQEPFVACREGVRSHAKREEGDQTPGAARKWFLTPWLIRLVEFCLIDFSDSFRGDSECSQ
jgi:hypothetical protein